MIALIMLNTLGVFITLTMFLILFVNAMKADKDEETYSILVPSGIFAVAMSIQMLITVLLVKL